MPTAITMWVSYSTGKDVFVDANATLMYSIVYSLIAMLSMSLGTTCLIKGVNDLKNRNDITLASLITLLSTALAIGVVATVVDAIYMAGTIGIYNNDINYGQPELVPYFQGRIVSYIISYAISVLKNIVIITLSALPFIIQKRRQKRG